MVRKKMSIFTSICLGAFNFLYANSGVGIVTNEKFEMDTIETYTTYYLDADNGNDSNSGLSPDSAWKSLAKASDHNFKAGEMLLLQRGDRFVGSLIFNEESGSTTEPIIVGAYGDSNSKPHIDAKDEKAGIYIQNACHIKIRDLEISANSTPDDSSFDKTRYGVAIMPEYGYSVDSITFDNLYVHSIFPPKDKEDEGVNPTTYMGFAFHIIGKSSTRSKNITIQNCKIENTGHSFLKMQHTNNAKILNNQLERIGGPGIVPNNCDDLLVRGNVMNGTGQFTDPRMHGRGSGIWPINCNRVLIEKNKFMHARGKYDSCGAHIDIGNTDVVIQYNLSLDNEGGFVEILGMNSNCTYRYNVSINDGARIRGKNGADGNGHTFLFSGHNKKGKDRAGPYNCYIYNNTIYVKGDQHASFAFEDTVRGALVANNLFYIEGDAGDGTDSWRANYSTNSQIIADSVIWTNNFYQRGGIFPQHDPKDKGGKQGDDDDWIFYEGSPIYGNPQFANAGGLEPTDYIPGPIVEGRSIEIPHIPGDEIGLRGGFKVDVDFFGNPIQGVPDIGAIEIGGDVSIQKGSAFNNLPEIIDNKVQLRALKGAEGSTYKFVETTKNFGGNSSDFSESLNYTDSGLIPNTPYSYELIEKDFTGNIVNTSAVCNIMINKSASFPSHLLIFDDFEKNISVKNITAPFPQNTWFCDASNEWSKGRGVEAQSNEKIRLGWADDENRLQQFINHPLNADYEYELTANWHLAATNANSLGFSAGIAECNSSGEIVQILKTTDVRPKGARLDAKGLVSVKITPEELKTRSIKNSNLIGIYFHRDDDGILESENAGDTQKSDIFYIDNVKLRYAGNPDLDSDEDGIPDGAEENAGLNKFDPTDALKDADNDGISNKSEYLQNSDINTPNKLFEISSENSGITIPAEKMLKNRLYILEQKENLGKNSNWRAVQVQSGTEKQNEKHTFNTTTESDAFYRVRMDWE